LKEHKTTNKKTLKTKMATALKDDTATLSTEMRNILIDDLVCAFENRFTVLYKAESKMDLVVHIEDTEIINATL